MKHFTTEDGLPSNLVYDIYRDYQGFLWFATDKGIARYNGERFEIFTTSNGLADNELFFFREDAYKRLWIATCNGELCFYQNGIFHTKANTSYLRIPFKISITRDISPERDSSISFLFYGQTKLLNLKNGHQTIIDFTASDDQALHASKIDDTKYLLTSIFNTSIINKKGNYIHNRKNLKNHTQLYYCVSQNTGYYYNENGIYDLQMHLLWPLKSTGVINKVFKDSTGIFICTNEGLLINDSIQVLGSEKIAGMTRDIAGNYWIGTFDNGAYQLDADFLKTRELKNVYKGRARFAYSDGNNLYLSTDQKLYRIRANKMDILFDFTQFNKKGVEFISDVGHLPDRDRMHLFIEHFDAVITGLKSGNIYTQVLNNKGNVRGAKNIINGESTIYLQGRNNIFYAPKEDLLQLKSISWNSIFPADHKQKIWSCAKDINDDIWFSTIDAVYKIVRNRPVRQHFFDDKVLKSFIFSGRYLIGYTHDNRLLISNTHNGKIFTNSIPDQNCVWNKMYTLDSDHVLISTNNTYRILKLYPSDSTPRFNIRQVTNLSLPVQAELILCDNSYSYFMKNGNITITDKQLLLKTSKPPVILFTEIKTKQRNYKVDTSLNIPFIESDNIQLSFSSLSFSAGKYFFEYSVSKDGSDHWLATTGETINMISPGYGSYIIKVRARDYSGKIFRPVLLHLHISKPYWSEWYFITFCSLFTLILIAMSGWYLFRYFMNRRQIAHDNQIKFLRSEYRVLNALINPHFIFNVLNNMQGMINSNDKHAANKYLVAFSKLLRQHVAHTSKDLISLQQEMQLVESYLKLEQLRFKNQLSYNINIAEDIDMDDILVSPLLIQPIVENAIKHGILPLINKAGHVDITIYQKGHKIYIKITDNGIGVDTAQKNKTTYHHSMGLENVRQRMQQLSMIQEYDISFTIEETKDDLGDVTGTIALIVIQTSTY